MFPQLPVQPSTEYTSTVTLNYDPIRFFDGTCLKTKSKTNRYPSINRHRRRGKPLPPSICILSTCDLTPSLIEAVGPLPPLLGGVCPILRAGAQYQCLR